MLGTFNTFCVTFDTVYVKKKKINWLFKKKNDDEKYFTF